MATLSKSHEVFRALWLISFEKKRGRKPFLSEVPVQSINLSEPPDKVPLHDKMVTLVDRMVDLHKHLDKAKNSNDKTRLQREIEATDRRIDRLVYELYHRVTWSVA